MNKCGWRELSPKLWPLISTYMPWNTHTHTRTPTYAHVHNIHMCHYVNNIAFCKVEQENTLHNYGSELVSQLKWRKLLSLVWGQHRHNQWIIKQIVLTQGKSSVLAYLMVILQRFDKCWHLSFGQCVQYRTNDPTLQVASVS